MVPTNGRDERQSREHSRRITLQRLPPLIGVEPQFIPLSARRSPCHRVPMPRKPRLFIPGMPQHVLMRGVDKQAVFFQPSDYNLYLEVLTTAARRYKCSIHAYVLMTNHVHLLATPAKPSTLPRIMQALGREYVQAINRRYGRTGTLWQGRYNTSLVQDDKYLLTCHRYIELNPVRAGMVQGPGEYPYSSYASNAMGRDDPLLTPHPTYRALHGDDEKRLLAYRALFQDELSEVVLERIREATEACLVLGNERFKDQIEKMLNRSVRHGKPGRPRKKGGGN